ncbi:diacylglycerol/lipid kinase family protein [Cellulomonas endophytica]|uniref:diacylglycerol/lipid kinase family protein n=1 Tax=Cellulomonas endophytica TaxID=2494735 RepID=UPI0010110715|nr:diacylglycerol kinase family protein [Cellulomonas endophytica]
MARLGLVVNGRADGGRAGRTGPLVRTALRARGHEVLEVDLPDPPGVAALPPGLDALVAVGGDGTVHRAVAAVAGTGLALGVVACGSGDDVARALGLPRHDVGAAVDRLDAALGAPARRVDLLAVGVGGAEVLCAAVVSCGVDAAVNARADGVRWPRGTARYVRALAGELRAFRPYGLRVVLEGPDGRRLVHRGPATLLAVAGTATFGGGLPIAPGADAADGLADVVLAGSLSRLGVLRILPALARGRHLRHPAVGVRRAVRVLVEADPSAGAPAPVAYGDGERLGPLPLTVQVVPGALRVLA